MNIERIDAVTFNVKGSDPEPYMVFYSINIGWTCTCMSFVMGMTDTVCKDCKHILRIKKEFNLA